MINWQKMIRMYHLTYKIPDVSDFDSNHSSIVIFEDLINESKKIQE